MNTLYNCNPRRIRYSRSARADFLHPKGSLRASQLALQIDPPRVRSSTSDSRSEEPEFESTFPYPSQMAEYNGCSCLSTFCFVNEAELHSELQITKCVSIRRRILLETVIQQAIMMLMENPLPGK